MKTRSWWRRNRPAANRAARCRPLRDNGERLLVGLLAHPRVDRVVALLKEIADLRIAGDVVVDKAEIDRRRGRDVVDRERAPGLVRHAALLARPGRASRRIAGNSGCPDADRLQVADHRLGLVALAIGVEVRSKPFGSRPRPAAASPLADRRGSAARPRRCSRIATGSRSYG